MGSTDPLAGVISSEYGIKPLLCWSVCGNELQVHGTESLGSHVCHGTNGLPARATFSFWSEPEHFTFDSSPGSLSPQQSVSPSSAGDSSPQRRGFDNVSRPGSASSPTGRKKLAARAVSGVEMGDGRRILVCLVSEHGVESEIHCLDPISGETLHVATGLPMMLTSLAILPSRFAVPPPSASWGGMVLRRGMSQVGLGDCGRAFDSAKHADFDDCNEIVAAVGGLGGGIRLVSMHVGAGSNGSPAAGGKARRAMARWPRIPGNVPSEREGIPISALEAFLVSGDGGCRTVMVAAGWRDGHWAVAPCYDYCGGIDGASVGRGDAWKASLPGDLAVGNTSGIGPSLHFVYQDDFDDWNPPCAARPCSAFRLWVGSAKGLMCFEVGTMRSNSTPPQPQVVAPLMTQHRALIAGAPPQFVRTMAIGGGPPLPLLVFASLRESDDSPVLVILDASIEERIGDAVAPSPDWTTPSTPPAGFPPIEIELWTRCCPKSVVAANPHSVWVNPLDVASFVCVGVAGAPEDGGSVVEPDGKVQADSSRKVSLKMSIIVSEASLREGGGTRLRAWEHKHVGAAHWVGAELERLGVMALCDPSQEDWDADITNCVNAVGRVALDHVVGGGEDGLWGRRYRRLAIRGVVTADGQATPAPRISRRPGVTMNARADGREEGEGTTTVAPLPDNASHGHCGVRPSTLLLAARLQGALALGQGPAVASALRAMVTTTVGGEWKLLRPRPVLEWAIAAALEAWEEARTLVTMRPSQSSLRNAMESFDAVARRSRQLDRILEASTERCRQYFEAARAVAFSEGRLTGGSRFSAARRVALARQKETAPLRRRLLRATLAARMALRVSSAGLWVLQAVEWPPRLSAGSETESCSDGGGVHGSQGASMATSVLSHGPLSLVREPAPMMKRLAEIAGLDGVYASGMESLLGGVLEERSCDPGSILAHVALVAGRDFEAANSSVVALSGGGRSVEEDEEGYQEAEDEGSRLDRGLAAVAYSVLTHVARCQKRGQASSDSSDCAGSMRRAGEARSPLGRAAEESFNDFCSQVCLSRECRVQARLSWLIDNQELSAAATALLSPWEEAYLCADPRLVELAVSAFTAADEGSNSGGSGGREGESRFSNLIWSMSKRAGREAEEGDGMDVEGEVLRGPSPRSIKKSKRRRDPFDVDRGHGHLRGRRSTLAIPDVLLEMDTRREPGLTVWEVSPGVAFRPARAERLAPASLRPPSAGGVPSSRSREDANSGLAGNPVGDAGRVSSGMTSPPRGRWQAVFETPRRIWRWISSSQRPARAANGEQSLVC